jgi:IclR family acetate operon transcriptional repressor
VQSLLRALGILDVLAPALEGLSLAEVVKATRLPPSTAHRLLTTLQQARHVQFDPHGARWSIGVKSFVIGNGFLNTRDIGRLCRPYLRRLVEVTGETANLAIEDEGMAVYLVQLESRQTMRAITKPGGRVFMHSSALGKAMLAHRPAADVDRIIAQRGMKRITGKTLVDPRKLAGELKQIRKNGYATDNEEYAPGLQLVAHRCRRARGSRGRPSIPGQVRVTSGGCGPGRVVGAAAEMTAEFGGRRPHRSAIGFGGGKAGRRPDRQGDIRLVPSGDYIVERGRRRRPDSA